MAKVEQGVHGYAAEGYQPPAEEAVREKLAWFQDQKLGFMTHFGAYALLGMFESWPMSDADALWSRRFVDWTTDGEQVRRDLFGLNRAFNPIRFQPEKWAEIVSACGFRYFLMTTKHHDGFCLWDTQYTDYKTTAPDCPYYTNEHADIVRSLFFAMREKGVGIGAYFSKADWHSADYWHDRRKTSRNPTYDIEADPARWERFVRFTQDQLLELGERYAPLDILWLDAGWVCKANGQDIRLEEVVPALRRKNPGLIVVDRTVGGAYENYITPEQSVPEAPLFVPWESCVSLGTGFSYRYDDDYKSPREVVHLLLDVVSKGGNLALNLAPQPDGRLPDPGVRTLRALGKWLETHGEGVYGTQPVAPYRQGDFALTAKGKTVYAFKLYGEGEAIPRRIALPVEKPIRSVRLLGYGAVPFTQRGGSALADMPQDAAFSGDPIAQGFACEMEG